MFPLKCEGQKSVFRGRKVLAVYLVHGNTQMKVKSAWFAVALFTCHLPLECAASDLGPSPPALGPEGSEHCLSVELT